MDWTEITESTESTKSTARTDVQKVRWGIEITEST